MEFTGFIEKSTKKSIIFLIIFLVLTLFLSVNLGALAAKAANVIQDESFEWNNNTWNPFPPNTGCYSNQSSDAQYYQGTHSGFVNTTGVNSSSCSPPLSQPLNGAPPVGYPVSSFNFSNSLSWWTYWGANATSGARDCELSLQGVACSDMPGLNCAAAGNEGECNNCDQCSWNTPCNGVLKCSNYIEQGQCEGCNQCNWDDVRVPRCDNNPGASCDANNNSLPQCASCVGAGCTPIPSTCQNKYSNSSCSNTASCNQCAGGLGCIAQPSILHYWYNLNNPAPENNSVSCYITLPNPSWQSWTNFERNLFTDWNVTAGFSNASRIQAIILQCSANSTGTCYNVSTELNCSSLNQGNCTNCAEACSWKAETCGGALNCASQNTKPNCTGCSQCTFTFARCTGNYNCALWSGNQTGCESAPTLCTWLDPDCNPTIPIKPDCRSIETENECDAANFIGCSTEGGCANNGQCAGLGQGACENSPPSGCGETIGCGPYTAGGCTDAPNAGKCVNISTSDVCGTCLPCAWNITSSYGQEMFFDVFGLNTTGGASTPDGSPKVTLNLPVNGNATNITSITFNCTASDDLNLTNVTLYGNFSGSWSSNGTNSTPVNNTPVTFDRTLSEGAYVWNCYACDNASQCVFAESNYSLTIDTRVPTPPFGTNPVDNYNSTSSSITFDFKCSDNVAVSTVQLWTNTTGTWHANYTNSSYTNDTWLNITVTGIPNGQNYKWGIYCNDTAGNSRRTAVNRTFNVSVSAGYTNVTNCTNITSSGEYRLQTKINGDATCINISANDVIFDGQGNSINEVPLGDSYGFYLKDINNVTIKNVTVASWTVDGIYSNNVTNSNFQNIVFLANAQDIEIIGGSGNSFSNLTFSTTSVNFSNSGDANITEIIAFPSDPTNYSNISKYVNISSSAWLWVNFSYSDANIPSGYNESNLTVWKNNGSWYEYGWNGSRILDTTNNVVGVNITTSGSAFIPMAGKSFGEDTTSPTYSNNGVNNTLNGSLANFYILYNDDTALEPNGGYIFSTNNTGTWVNDSYIAWLATPSWANVTKTLNNTPGLAIGYRWYANDSAGNRNDTSVFTLVTIASDTTGPTFSNNSTNSTYAGQSVKHSVLVTDNNALSGYIFSFDNGSGSFVNDSFVAFSTNPEWANVTKVANSTVGTTINWKVYANDTSNNWNVSSYSYVTASPPITGNVSGCGTISVPGVYTLNQSIANGSSCMHISSDDVILDCNGNSITYAYGATGYGIETTSTTENITIQNCTITQNTSTYADSYAILFSSSSNGTIKNNIITTRGQNTYGLYLFSSSNNNITRNRMETPSGSGTGQRIFYSYYGNNNLFENNNITIYSSTGYGVFLEESDFNNLNRNFVNTTQTDSFGIYLFSNSNSNNITNNSIVVSGAANTALHVQSSPNNYVLSTNLTTSGTTGTSYGVYVISSNDTYFENVIINTVDIGNGRGIYLENSNNTIINKTTKTSSGANSPGIVFNSSRNTKIINSNILPYGTQLSHSLYFIDGNNDNTTVWDSNITQISVSDTNFSSTSSGTVNFTNVTFQKDATFVSGSTAKLYVRWYIWANVTNSVTGAPLNGVTVVVKNLNNTGLLSDTWTDTTNVSGLTPMHINVEYMQNYTAGGTGIYNMTPHNFNATDSLGVNNNTNYSISTNAVVPILLGTDISPPTITFVNPPANNTWFATSTVVINASVVDTQTNISACILEWNGVNESGFMTKSRNGTSIYCYTSKGGLSNGNYTYRVYANDSAGNMGVSGKYVLFVDLIKPFIVLGKPANGNYSEINTTNFGIKCWDNMASTLTMYFYLDSVLNTTGYAANNTWWNVTKVLTDGTHTWYGRCYDNASNYNTSETRTLYINAHEPYVTQDSPPNWGLVIRNPIDFICTGTDVHGMSNLSLWFGTISNINETADEYNVSPATHTFPRNLSDGTYTWGCLGADGFGKTNINTYTSSSITVDSTKPVLTFVSPTPNNGQVLTSGSFSVHADVTDDHPGSAFVDWNSYLQSYLAFEEASGSTAYDNSSYGTRYGTLGSRVSRWKWCVRGYCTAYLGDTGTSTTIANSVNIEPTADGDLVVLDFWHYTVYQEFAVDPPIVIQKIGSRDGDPTGYQFSIGNDGYLYFTYYEDDITHTHKRECYTGEAAVSLYTWNHYAIKFQDSTDGYMYVYFYVNNVLQTHVHGDCIEGGNYARSTFASVSVGGAGTCTGYECSHGYLDEVRLWKRSLSDYEIGSSYGTYSDVQTTFSGLADNSEQTFYAYAIDDAGNMNKTETRTVYVDLYAPVVTLAYPRTNANFNTSSSNVIFGCVPWDSADNMANMTLYGNWSGGWHANQTALTPGINQITEFSKSIPNGIYVFNCYACDVYNRCSYASSNNTFLMDSVFPTISLVPPTPNNNSVVHDYYVPINASVNDTNIEAAFVDFNRSLKLYLSFEEKSGTSTTVYDKSSYGNNGTMIKMPQGFDNVTTAGVPRFSGRTRVGKFGQGMNFNQTSSAFVRSTNDDSLSLSQNFTIESWVYAKTKPVATDHAAIVGKGYDGFGGTPVLNYLLCLGDYETSSSYVCFYHYPGYWEEVCSTSQISLNAWHHIVLTYDKSANDMRIYIDGKLDKISSLTAPMSTNSYPVYIGAYNYTTTTLYPFNGTIDEVKIWNRTLTTKEINASYNNQLYRLDTNITVPSDGNYTYNVFAIDKGGNINATGLRTVVVDASLKVYLNQPANNTNLYGLGSQKVNVTFNCSAISGAGLKNITLYGNWTSWGAKNSSTITGSENSSKWYNSLAEATYLYNCYGCNLNNDCEFNATNFTFRVRTNPSIYFVPPTPDNGGYGGQNVTINVTTEDSNLGAAYIDWNYTLSGYWAFNEQSGTTVYDNSTHGNNGTLINNTNRTTGKFGSGLMFNRTYQQYVRVPDADSLDLTNAFTIEAWVLPTDAVTELVVSKTDTNSETPGSGYALRLSGGDIISCIFKNSLSKKSVEIGLSGGMTYNDGNWHYLACVHDNSTGKFQIYYDNLTNSTTEYGSADANSYRLNIGRESEDSGTSNAHYFNGTIDEVRIHKRALSESEINASRNNSQYRLYTTISGLESGQRYFVSALVTDTDNNMNSTETRNFTLDLIPPIITVISPLNITYSTNSVWANVSLNEDGYSCVYNLDNTGNVTMTKLNATYFYKMINGLSVGGHNITFYCDDLAHNMNQSEYVYFTINDIPVIYFVTPTDDNATTVSRNWTYVNTTITDDHNISSCKLEWDGTNETTSISTTHYNQTFEHNISLGQTANVADVYATNTTSSRNAFQTKWNIVSIPTNSIVKEATLCIYWAGGPGLNDVDVNYSRVDDQDWSEWVIFDWNTQSLTNTTIGSFVGNTTQKTWGCLNVTDMIKTDYADLEIIRETIGMPTQYFSSIRVEDPDSPIGPVDRITVLGGLYIGSMVPVNFVVGEDRENSLRSGNRPYLNITYYESIEGKANCYINKSGSTGMHNYKVYANDTNGGWGVSETRQITFGTVITECMNFTQAGEYILGNSVKANGTCFRIFVDNVSLACDTGVTITYSMLYEGYGVWSNASNSVVSSCLFNQTNVSVNNSHGVMLTNGIGANINDNTMQLTSPNAAGIYLANESYSTFVSNYVGPTTYYGVYINASSNGNNITNNSLPKRIKEDIFVYSTTVNNSMITNKHDYTPVSVDSRGLLGDLKINSTVEPAEAPNGYISLDKYINLSTANNGNVTVKMHYQSEEISLLNLSESSLRVWKSNHSWQSPLSVTDFCGEELGGNEANLTIDDDLLTSWADLQEHEHNITYDLEGSFNLSGIKIFTTTMDPGAPCGARISLSNDSIAWQDVADQDFLLSGETGWNEINFNYTNARYIRLYLRVFNDLAGGCEPIYILTSFYEFKALAGEWLPMGGRVIATPADPYYLPYVEANLSNFSVFGVFGTEGIDGPENLSIFLREDNVTTRLNWSVVGSAEGYYIWYDENVTKILQMDEFTLDTPNVTLVGADNNTWNDTTAGEAVKRFYAVAAYRGSVKGFAQDRVGKHNITINSEGTVGHTLMSFPLEGNLSVSSIPAPNNFTYIYTINESGNDSWEYAYYYNSWKGDLDLLEFGKGYYFNNYETGVNITTVGKIPVGNVTGAINNESEISHTLLGWESYNNGNISEILTDVPNNFTYIYTINESGNDSWEYAYYYNSWKGSLSEFEPLKGYYFNNFEQSRNLTYDRNIH